MPEENNNSALPGQATEKRTDNTASEPVARNEYRPAPFPAAGDELAPLRRMRQLSQEIRDGLSRDNLELVGQAAVLLAPALEEWQVVCAETSVGAGEAAQLALDTWNVLQECERLLTQAMQQISEELIRLRQGKRAVVYSRPQPPTPFGRKLDTLR